VSALAMYVMHINDGTVALAQRPSIWLQPSTTTLPWALSPALHKRSRCNHFLPLQLIPLLPFRRSISLNLSPAHPLPSVMQALSLAAPSSVSLTPTYVVVLRVPVAGLMCTFALPHLHPQLSLVLPSALPQLLFTAPCHTSLRSLPHLIPLQKHSAGVRPLAVSETWLRLFGFCIMNTYSDVKLGLASLHLGAGVSGGIPCVAHALCAGIGADPACGTVQVDFCNAFNEVTPQLLAAISRRAPQLLPFV
jgi:hypothetical protein